LREFQEIRNVAVDEQDLGLAGHAWISPSKKTVNARSANLMPAGFVPKRVSCAKRAIGTVEGPGGPMEEKGRP
jgi:hypothetical protein